MSPNNFTYWHKLIGNEDHNILWNIPTQKSGRLSVFGGNSENFLSEIRTTEFLEKLPIKTLKLYLPDALQNKLPVINYIDFLKSTPSGSFDRHEKLTESFLSTDTVFLSGNFSKNSTTSIAVNEALKSLHENQVVVACRDAIEIITNSAEENLQHENLVLLATMPQLQKLFQAIYFPKMLLLSMPLTSVIETLHKFTISYPLTLITLHSDQIIMAKAGEVYTIRLDHTNFTPLSLWTGMLPAKIAALATWNPQNLLDVATASINWDVRQI